MAGEAARREGLEWPRLEEWKGVFFRVAVEYLDNPEGLRGKVGAIKGTFPEVGGYGFKGTLLTGELPIFAGGEGEAKERAEAFVSKLVEAMKGDGKLQSLREVFLGAMTNLKDELNLMIAALRQILYKKNLNLKKRWWGLSTFKCPYLEERILDS